jgi:uncharacterized protein YlxW (UPF0749 family)
MSRIGDKAILFILSIALGFMVMMQLHTAQNILGSENTSEDRNVELNEELASLNLEKSQLEDELEELQNKNKQNEQISLEREEELAEVEEELNKQKILSGYYDVKGPGTIINIDAEPDAYVSLASSHQYILALISYLNNAGVEAISINGQRYTNYTEIVPVLDHINVNGVALVLPLEIKAIGYSRTIEASLNFVGGIVSQMQSAGFIITTENSDEIFINKYDGEKQFKYAVPAISDEEQ